MQLYKYEVVRPSSTWTKRSSNGVKRRRMPRRRLIMAISRVWKWVHLACSFFPSTSRAIYGFFGARRKESKEKGYDFSYFILLLKRRIVWASEWGFERHGRVPPHTHSSARFGSARYWLAMCDAVGRFSFSFFLRGVCVVTSSFFFFSSFLLRVVPCRCHGLNCCWVACFLPGLPVCVCVCVSWLYFQSFKKGKGKGEKRRERESRLEWVYSTNKSHGLDPTQPGPSRAEPSNTFPGGHHFLPHSTYQPPSVSCVLLPYYRPPLSFCYSFSIPPLLLLLPTSLSHSILISISKFKSTYDLILYTLSTTLYWHWP